MIKTILGHQRRPRYHRKSKSVQRAQLFRRKKLFNPFSVAIVDDESLAARSETSLH